MCVAGLSFVEVPNKSQHMDRGHLLDLNLGTNSLLPAALHKSDTNLFTPKEITEGSTSRDPTSRNKT